MSRKKKNTKAAQMIISIIDQDGNESESTIILPSEIAYTISCLALRWRKKFVGATQDQALEAEKNIKTFREALKNKK